MQVVNWFKNHRRERRSVLAGELEILADSQPSLSPTLLCPETPQSLRDWGAERCVCPPRVCPPHVDYGRAEAAAELRAREAEALLGSQEWKDRWRHPPDLPPAFAFYSDGCRIIDRPPGAGSSPLDDDIKRFDLFGSFYPKYFKSLRDEEEAAKTHIRRWEQVSGRCICIHGRPRSLPSAPGPWRAANVEAILRDHHDGCECNCCETYGLNSTTREIACRAALDDLIKRVEIEHGEYEDSSEDEGESDEQSEWDDY